MNCRWSSRHQRIGRQERCVSNRWVVNADSSCMSVRPCILCVAGIRIRIDDTNRGVAKRDGTTLSEATTHSAGNSFYSVRSQPVIIVSPRHNPVWIGSHTTCCALSCPIFLSCRVPSLYPVLLRAGQSVDGSSEASVAPQPTGMGGSPCRIITGPSTVWRMVSAGVGLSYR